MSNHPTTEQQSLTLSKPGMESVIYICTIFKLKNVVKVEFAASAISLTELKSEPNRYFFIISKQNIFQKMEVHLYIKVVIKRQSDNVKLSCISFSLNYIMHILSTSCSLSRNGYAFLRFVNASMPIVTCLIPEHIPRTFYSSPFSRSNSFRLYTHRAGTLQLSVYHYKEQFVQGLQKTMQSSKSLKTIFKNAQLLKVCI